jgi:hypothetical protein
MSSPENSRPAERPARPNPDPLVMTPGEKVAAEWEARHDVAARGRHGAPDTVQRYLASGRSAEPHDPTKNAPVRAPRATAAGEPAEDAGNRLPPHPAAPVNPQPRARWWRRLRRHGG